MINSVNCPEPYLYIVMLGHDVVFPPNVKTEPGLLVCLAAEINDGTVKEVPSVAAMVITWIIEVEVKGRADLGLVTDTC